MRDDRDPRGREERDLARPKVDRVSHEPPSLAKDVSPPPIAPSAPAFGSVPVPSRQASTTSDIQSLTGKAPPTGPRALTDERPVSGGSDRHPPTGPSKAAVPDLNPPIPVGPRAQQQPAQAQQPQQQQQQQRSSKQWINPALQGKKPQESPKLGRSHSFVSQQPRPFGSGYRPESSHSDQPAAEFGRRPRRSSDAQSESHLGTAGGQLRDLHMGGRSDIAVKSERGTPSARTSVDRDVRPATPTEDKMDIDHPEPLAKSQDNAVMKDKSPSPHHRAARDQSEELEEGETVETPEPMNDVPQSQQQVEKEFIVDAPCAFVEIPDTWFARQPTSEESSESEDEDMDDYFDQQIAMLEAELRNLDDETDAFPKPLIKKYLLRKGKVVWESGWPTKQLITRYAGPLPPSFELPHPQQTSQMPETKVSEAKTESRVTPAAEVQEASAIPTVEDSGDTAAVLLEPQPKVEESEGPGLPALPTLEHADTNGDIEMTDATEVQTTAAPEPADLPVNGIIGDNKETELPIRQEHAISGHSSPEPMDEDSEDRTEDDASVYGSVEAVREFSATPPTDELPVFRSKPWQESKRVRKSFGQNGNFGSFILGHMKEQLAVKRAEQAVAREDYGKNYDYYLRFTLSDDPTATKSRDYFSSTGTPIPSSNGKPTVAPESKPEGRRGRYATELDVEYVLQQSMREHEEKQEREARAQQEKFRSEKKEAAIPKMYWSPEDREESLFYDTAGLLPVEKLVSVWQVVPPTINFTEEEAEKFEKSYLENPKQWGKIAREVPNRDFKACIQYYYAKKKELNLKDKLKKQPRRRKKGRGKQRSSALVSELGNTENETEENQDTGENGERRRPRRAAAPTWGYEATPTGDSEGNTPSGTPGRRRGPAASNDAKQDGEKAEPKRGGRRARQPKVDKEKTKPPVLAPQPPAVPTTPGATATGAAAAAATAAAAVTPTATAKAGRSRSNSRAQVPTEWTTTPPVPGPELGRLPTSFEVPALGMQPPLMPVQQPPLSAPEPAPPSSLSGVMAPPSGVMAPPALRPDPPPPPPSAVATFDISGPDRNRTPVQASSYWSVAEVNDFPGLLRSFGTDWGKIADHMQSKTPVMVRLSLPLS